MRLKRILTETSKTLFSKVFSSPCLGQVDKYYQLGHFSLSCHFSRCSKNGSRTSYPQRSEAEAHPGIFSNLRFFITHLSFALGSGYRIFPLIFFVLFPGLFSTGYSQEMLGIMNSNYSGVNSMIINPANSGVSREPISVNLLAGDVFINSNYFYIHKKDYSFLNLFKVEMSDPQYMYIYDYPEFFFKDTVQYYDYKKNVDPKQMYFNFRIVGPSFIIRKGNHAFSLMTGFRNAASVEDVPYDAANFAFRGQDFAPQHNIEYNHGMFRFAALSWIELGLGYTYTFYKDQKSEISAGVMVKGLMATGGAYGVIDNVDYMVPNHDSIYFYNMNATLVLDLPMDYATNQFQVGDPLIRGWGASIDLGLNYQIRGEPILGNSGSYNQNREFEEDYLWKFGLSAIDFGKIFFNKSVEYHEFRNVQNVLWSGLSNFHPESIQSFLRSASYHLLGDSLASITGKSAFGVFLPSAVSFQGDYYFGKDIFLNATFLQGIRIGQPSVRRPSLLALTPRYETENFEVNLPVSLYDFRDPAIGLAIRVYSLIIGTEKLGTFLNLTDVRGMDFYFSIGFNITPKNKNWHYKKTKAYKCESFDDYKRYRNK